MNETLARARLLELLEGDEELFESMCTAGLLPRKSTYSLDEAEAARVARTLVRELEVNLPGVEIILRMRAELFATRRQVGELLALLRGLSDGARR